jgi:hypothetical protein
MPLQWRHRGRDISLHNKQETLEAGASEGVDLLKVSIDLHLHLLHERADSQENGSS